MVVRTQQEPEDTWDMFDKLELSPTTTDTSTTTLGSDDPEVSIHSLPSREGLLVKIEPPRCPANSSLSHVPCDIVLVIDVSYSMYSAAPVVVVDDGGMVNREHSGYCVLDICKVRTKTYYVPILPAMFGRQWKPNGVQHAALTVLETLDERDRLGIITFSTTAKVVQALQPMTSSNKKQTAGRIRALKQENVTNLWQGLVQGLRLFEGSEDSGRVPAILVLTDGQPNCQHPAAGYIPTIRSMPPLPATIHTFGFGNDIKSGLLKSIAEIGGGSYSFIPDSGMVGTVFVNAVAHLQSTFANRCTLDITYPAALCLRKTSGQTAESEEKDEIDSSSLGYILGVDGERYQTVTVPLGNLQYGQSRDIYLESDVPHGSFEWSKDMKITAKFRFSRMYDAHFLVGAKLDTLRETSLSESEIAYHRSRAMICEYISSIFPLKADGEHDMPALHALPTTISAARMNFKDLVTNIPAKHFRDTYNASLMQDLLGQIQLAVFDNDYFSTWGPHYFLSLWDAHAKQVRNTFKDPGVQMYDINSPLFLACQKKLTYAFDTAVQPPEPSLKAQADIKYRSGAVAISMSSYNDRDYPCFSASSLVTLANNKNVPVGELRRGVTVQTLLGNRKVVAILKTRVRKITLCRIEDLLITPWHPVFHGESWAFPAHVAQKAVRYSGAIYSVLLEPDSDPQAHAIQVGGVWAVTLGHGILRGKDIRAHEFLGDHAKVSRALSLVGVGSGGIAVASGVRREKRSGRLRGFKRGNLREQTT
ncbi:putative Hint-domain-containing protein [Seiridium unicorne]|uniref:Hint-domain-containing protein n=1 Tax=Seiridium unicorne TaxID=138068 RepID=A0ABR2UZ95_9PEZI